MLGLSLSMPSILGASRALIEAIGAQSIAGFMTFSRSTAAGDGAGGAVGANVPRFAGGGLTLEGGRTFYLANSAAPATQTTPSLPIGTYTLSLTGSGTAAITAGTGVATGLGAATAASPVTFQVTTAGTFTVTPSGGPTSFQLEDGDLRSSFFPTTTVPITRAPDLISCPLSALGITATGAGTYLYSFVPVGQSTVLQAFAQIDNGTGAERWSPRINANSAAIGLAAVTGNVATFGPSPGSVNFGARNCLVISVLGDGTARASLNGAATVISTAGPTGGLTTARQNGLSSGASQIFASMKMQAMPLVGSAAQVQALSAAGF